MMGQVTPKTLEEALLWIHTNAHYESGIEYDSEGRYVKAQWFKNHFDKMRVPRMAPYSARFHDMIQPNPRKFDTRMYSLTPQGKRILYASVYGIEAKEQGV
jgi:hypothetical protein